MRRRRLVAGTAAALAAVGSSGCAAMFAPQARALQDAVTREGALGRAIELSGVPFFAQTAFHCGPAALATALGAIGITAQPEALADAVFLPARDGSLQVEMLAAPRRHGALATRIPGELRATIDELHAGHPALVLQNLGLAWRPLWHYAVVVGMNAARSEIVLRSGTMAREVMPLATFELTWARSNHWAFVVTTPGTWPVTARVEDAEQAAVGFELVAEPGLALRAHRSLRERWPLRLVGWIGEGNALLKLARHREAAEVFETAATGHDSAVAWNNLAVARARVGDVDAALRAVEKAVIAARAKEPSLLAAVSDTRERLLRGEVP